MRQGDKREELIKLHDTHVEVRNIVCHKSCGGHQKSDPDRIIFASAKTLRKMPGQMEIMLVHVDQFRDAIKFATTSANQIADIVDALVAQIDELRSREP